MEKLKVLFHVDEMEKWKLTLANINNFFKWYQGFRYISCSKCSGCKRIYT